MRAGKVVVTGALLLFSALIDRAVWHFDPFDRHAWLGVQQLLRSGGSVPLSFVVGQIVLGVLCVASVTRQILETGQTLSDFTWSVLRHGPPGVTWWHRVRLLRSVLTRPAESRKTARPPARREAPMTHGGPTVALQSNPPTASHRTPPPAECGTGGMSAGVTSAPGISRPSSDLACLLAVAEVWQEPPAPWMRAVAAAALPTVSAASWTILDGLGPAAAPLRAMASAMGLHPPPPTRGPAIGVAPPQPLRPVLTPTAALLGERLDNFLFAEAGARSGDTARHHGRATAARADLQRTMAAMTEADWTSLDHDPARAQYLRVASDQIREAFRTQDSALPPRG